MSTVPKVLAVYRKPKEEFVPKKKTRYELWSEYLDTDSPSYDGFGFAMFIHEKLSKENEEQKVKTEPGYAMSLLKSAGILDSSGNLAPSYKED